MSTKDQLEASWLNYMRRAQEAGQKFNKTQSEWRSYKRQLDGILWEHDFTQRQMEILSTLPMSKVMRPRKYFHQQKFFNMKADYYAIQRDGPQEGKMHYYLSLKLSSYF